ncbi:MAG: FKBP-type peptidyl-prolyl cis-trans isomerase [Deltaproteobacteria bacterium]|nr:FKBP-type peptidyl-prolyl cis-trans isomerase [Deltaproteobacteria bacterium]
MRNILITLSFLLAVTSCEKKCDCKDQNNKAAGKKADTTDKKVDGGNVKLDSLEKKLSYIVGYDLARNFGSKDIKLDIDVVKIALLEGMAKKEARLSREDIQKVMMEVRGKMMGKAKNTPKADPEKAKKAEENLKAGTEFLAKNKAVKGVVETASGLQYQIITEGKGAKPAATDVVSVHYKGTLLDGRKFDSSYDRNKPAEFPVNRVIRGWTEALQLMPVGSKWKLWIPAKIAYGLTPRPGGIIEPNHLLVFEVELLGIKGK